MILSLSFILLVLVVYWFVKQRIHLNDLKKQAKEYPFEEWEAFK